ncbi:MAG TPA: APC family permease [Bacillota bacterium]|jgi:amino acid transporter
MEDKTSTELRSGALGFWECFAIAVGGMVGMAIFSLSGVTFSMAGPAAVLSWILAGLIVLVYALNVAEMATKFPRAGGIYVYPSESLGSNPVIRQLGGWLAAWSWINVTILGTAFGAIFVAQYLGGIIPALGKYVVPMGFLGVAFVYLLNAFGVSIMGISNLIMTGGLGLIVLIYIIVAAPHGSAANLTPFFSGTMGSSGFAASIPIAMLAYGSVIAVASAAEEIRDAKRTIPRAMGWSMVTVIIGYAVTLLVTYAILPVSQVTAGSFGYYAPLHFAIAVAQLPSWLSALVSLGALLAIITTMLVMIMDAGRTMMAMGRSGLLPKAFAYVHPKTKTPLVSLTLASAAAAIIACFPNFTSQIINTGSTTFAVLVVIIVVSVISSRLYRKDVRAAFTAPGGYALQIIALLTVVFSISQLQHQGVALSAWWYAIGLAYFLIRWAAGGFADVKTGSKGMKSGAA